MIIDAPEVFNKGKRKPKEGTRIGQSRDTDNFRHKTQNQGI